MGNCGLSEMMLEAGPSAHLSHEMTAALFLCNLMGDHAIYRRSWNHKWPFKYCAIWMDEINSRKWVISISFVSKKPFPWQHTEKSQYDNKLKWKARPAWMILPLCTPGWNEMPALLCPEPTAVCVEQGASPTKTASVCSVPCYNLGLELLNLLFSLLWCLHSET